MKRQSASYEYSLNMFASVLVSEARTLHIKQIFGRVLVNVPWLLHCLFAVEMPTCTFMTVYNYSVIVILTVSYVQCPVYLS